MQMSPMTKTSRGRDTLCSRDFVGVNCTSSELSSDLGFSVVAAGDAPSLLGSSAAIVEIASIGPMVLWGRTDGFLWTLKCKARRDDPRHPGRNSDLLEKGIGVHDGSGSVVKYQMNDIARLYYRNTI
jgi:hypothetical protein